MEKHIRRYMWTGVSFEQKSEAESMNEVISGLQIERLGCDDQCQLFNGESF